MKVQNFGKTECVRINEPVIRRNLQQCPTPLETNTMLTFNLEMNILKLEHLKAHFKAYLPISTLICQCKCSVFVSPSFVNISKVDNLIFVLLFIIE